MNGEPIISPPWERIAATGASFALHEWSHGPGGGPPLHVHHHDDEAWHVLEGRLRFRFADRTVDAGPGSSVFVPAGVAHTFGNPDPEWVRYLIVTTRRVPELIDALHALADPAPNDVADTYRRYDAEILE